ncbi:hypothetical protein B0H21DRAFT_822210 [Amylocystis lapponica]|nr:hypothetical protein B0H21DRAFT_822210 [Amylocystis lapponica]
MCCLPFRRPRETKSDDRKRQQSGAPANILPPPPFALFSCLVPHISPRTSWLQYLARTFARSATPNHTLLPTTTRPNSSAAAQPAVPANAAAAAPKRSVPIASVFGDIAIPSAKHVQSTGARTANGIRPDLSWLGDDEFDTGNTLARRLARRQSQPQTGRVDTSAKNPPASDPPPLWPAAPQSTPGIYVPTRNDRQARPARDAERARVTPGRQTGIEGGQGRGREGQANLPDQGNNRQARPARDTGRSWAPRREAGKEGRQTGGREGQAERGQRQNSDRNRNREPQNRERRTQASRPRGQQDKTSSESSAIKATTPGSMHIQTTDLDSLFGHSPAAQSVMTAPAKTKGVSRGAMPAALRLQLTLEHRGGDYSRYMPAIRGLDKPEELGPLGAAQLVMARRKGAGLKMRRNALGVVQRLVVSEVGTEAAP